MEGLLRYNDLLIAIACFSIPVQIVLSLYKYPRLQAMGFSVIVLVVLFMFFIFSCGIDHFLRFFGIINQVVLDIINTWTMVISVITALYLIPAVPNLMRGLDKQITERTRQNDDVAAFTAFLCHEIRTPLFCITSAATFCEDGDDIQESVASIKTSTNQILRLVNDVFEISRLGSGRMRLEERPFHLRETLDRISSSTDAQVKEKGSNVVFRQDVQDGTPAVVCGDPARISQILNILTSNAVKYTNEGTIELRVEAVEYEEALQRGLVTLHGGGKEEANLTKKYRCRDANRDSPVSSEADHLQNPLIDSSADMEEGRAVELAGPMKIAVLKIVVRDTGCGIAPERVDLIFQPYTQAKLNESRRHGGTGLKLSISAKLIARMNGSLHVHSVKGQGSTFVVFLPIWTGKQRDTEIPIAPIRKRTVRKSHWSSRRHH